MASAIKFENKEEEAFWKDLIKSLCHRAPDAKVVEWADYFTAQMRSRMPVERVPYGESFPRYKGKETITGEVNKKNGE